MKTILFILMAFLAYSGTVTSQTEEDKKIILQKCIDLPQLQEYYHTDIHPERIPLIVENNGKVPVVSLSKFGQQVKFLTESELEAGGKDAYLNFVRFEISGSTATIMYKYAVEGVMITVLLKKSNGSWEITESKLTER